MIVWGFKAGLLSIWQRFGRCERDGRRQGHCILFLKGYKGPFVKRKGMSDADYTALVKSTNFEDLKAAETFKRKSLQYLKAQNFDRTHDPGEKCLRKAFLIYLDELENQVSSRP